MQGITSSQLRVLSSGNQSQIYSYGPPGASVVLKAVPSSCRKEQKHLRNQWLTLQGLCHPHVIRCLKFREDVAFPRNQQDKQPATHSILVLEQAQKGNLLSFLLTQKPDLNKKRNALRQVLQAIRHLHSQGVAHRDLKLENILVFVSQQNEEIFKVADFGFASRFKGEEGNMLFKDYKGTKKAYMAPEIHAVRRDPSKQYDAPKTDIFALGVIAFTLVFGRFPFEHATVQDRLYRLVQQKNFQLFWAEHKSDVLELDPGYRMEQFKPLFEKMVSYQPGERPTAEEVSLNGWFVKGSSQSL